MGSLRSSEIYKYFCTTQMGMWHMHFMLCHRVRGSPPWWWSPLWSAATLRPPMQERPSAHSTLASRVPCLNKTQRCAVDVIVKRWFRRDPCARVSSALESLWPLARSPTLILPCETDKLWKDLNKIRDREDSSLLNLKEGNVAITYSLQIQMLGSLTHWKRSQKEMRRSGLTKTASSCGWYL
jgi:hypothetical protein